MFENVVCEMAAILSRPQCVNWHGLHISRDAANTKEQQELRPLNLVTVIGPPIDLLLLISNRSNF